jgi:hypothetical protein
MLMSFYFPSYLTIRVFSDERGLDRQYEPKEEKPKTWSSTVKLLKTLSLGGDEAMTS